MPFVKRDVTAPSTESRRPTTALRRILPPCIVQMRRLDGAPRARLAAVPMRSPALAAALGVEQVARVREAIMTALIRVGDEASVMALLPYIRSQDAGQRAASIEALQAMPEAILPFMATLLADSDSDVRLSGDRIGPQHAGRGRNPDIMQTAAARAAPQCLRRGGRRAGGGGDARRGARTSGLRRTICRQRRFCHSPCR